MQRFNRSSGFVAAQLFFNLIDNTLKHSQKGTQIRISYIAEADAVKLIYEDDGVGFSDDLRGRIFDASGNNGITRGLFVVGRICESYGWNIQETGKNGVGAQFTITIPKHCVKC